jgi:hypothetical protein
MNIHPHNRVFVDAALVAIVLCAVLPVRSSADSHPQEVLDLIAAYDALAMKVRPLQDRVAVAAASGSGDSSFRPEGVPLRATTTTSAAADETSAERRVSENLRHKDRAVPADDYGRIEVRLSALEAKARAERERISRPEFGVDLSRSGGEAGAVRFGDARRGTRPPSSSPEPAPPVDPGAIAQAQRNLAAMQKEYAALEREVSRLERR